MHMASEKCHVSIITKKSPPRSKRSGPPALQLFPYSVIHSLTMIFFFSSKASCRSDRWKPWQWASFQSLQEAQVSLATWQTIAWPGSGYSEWRCSIVFKMGVDVRTFELHKRVSGGLISIHYAKERLKRHCSLTTLWVLRGIKNIWWSSGLKWMYDIPTVPFFTMASPMHSGNILSPTFNAQSKHTYCLIYLSFCINKLLKK